jgi:hypothetical protein
MNRNMFVYVIFVEEKYKHRKLTQSNKCISYDYTHFQSICRNYIYIYIYMCNSSRNRCTPPTFLTATWQVVITVIKEAFNMEKLSLGLPTYYNDTFSCDVFYYCCTYIYIYIYSSCILIEIQKGSITFIYIYIYVQQY